MPLQVVFLFSSSDKAFPGTSRSTTHFHDPLTFEACDTSSEASLVQRV